jgi:HK97 family phage major capsid protein
LKISALIEKRNALMSQISTLAKTENLTSEQRSQFDAMAADLEILNTDIQRLEFAENLESELRSNNRPPRANPGAEQRQTENEAERRAFENYIRFGTRSQELRAIGEGSVSGNLTVSAGVAVPTGVGNVSIAQKTVGSLASAVNQMTTDSGSAINIPLVDDTAAADLHEVGELVNDTEQEPAVAGITSTVQKLTSGIVYVSEELLADSAFSVDALITKLFQTRLVNGLSKRVFAGNSGSFAAITANAPVKVTTAGGTAIAWNELTQLYGSIDAAYRENGSWVMNSATHAYLMGITSTTGQPILQPDTTGRPFMSLLSKPIVIAENAPGIALGSAPILFGDLSSYTLRTTRGIGIQRNDAIGFVNGSVAFKLTVRAGGFSTSQSASPAIAQLKMKAS